MNLRETLYKTVKCSKSRMTRTVQETIIRLSEQKGQPDQIAHEYKCGDFTSCRECANCQYHQ